MDEVDQLREALQNCLGFLDTPIARRRIGIDPDAEWLQEARKLADGKLTFKHTVPDYSSIESRLSSFAIPTVYGTGRKQSEPEPQRQPADAGSHKFTDYAMPKIGDRVIWTSDPDPTCSLKGVKGTVKHVYYDGRFPHFEVTPDDWPTARIYSTWRDVDPVLEEEDGA